jgi:hypothetical protein
MLVLVPLSLSFINRVTASVLQICITNLDPDADPDPTCHFDAYLDPDHVCHFDADSDPTYLSLLCGFGSYLSL